jgi:hypothetical protein
MGKVIFPFYQKDYPSFCIVAHRSNLDDIPLRKSVYIAKGNDLELTKNLYQIAVRGQEQTGICDF